MVPEFSMVPELMMVPELSIVTPDGIVTIIPEGITTISSPNMSIGGAVPPHVVESFQSPL